VIGIYECVTRDCPRRGLPIEHVWHSEWPLGKRQKTCASCGVRMLFMAVKKQMTDEAKRKLRAYKEAKREPVG